MAESCPLCGREKYMRRQKPLYGHNVCKKCYYGFANRRQFAFILDSFFLRLVGFFCGVILGNTLTVTGVDQASIIQIATVLDVGMLAIFLFKDGLGGYSPGKAICGVQVLDVDTREPIGFGASLKRNLPLLIPLVPLIVAFQLIKGTRTGDGWAHSRVVWKKYRDHPIFAFGTEPESEETTFAEPDLEETTFDPNPYRSPKT